jgi:hypothetical protein
MFPNEEETKKIRLETIYDYPSHLVRVINEFITALEACEDCSAKRVLLAALIQDVFGAGVRRGNELAVRLLSGEGH